MGVVVGDPLEVLEKLGALMPDRVLMDVHLSEIDLERTDMLCQKTLANLQLCKEFVKDLDVSVLNCETEHYPANVRILRKS